MRSVYPEDLIDSLTVMLEARARPRSFSPRRLGGCYMAKTVLVADDNPIIRKMLCRIFEAEDGYDLCAEATNGQEAIDLALKCRPELIILDLSMPVMNGLDAARELKKLMPGVPIILFTQYSDLGSALSRELNVDRIVSKGNATELMGHVKQLLPV
jgi:CheY-like chemotaxis protein